MRSWRGICGVVCCIVVLSGGVLYISAQGTGNPDRVGVPQDWSSRQVVFTRDGLKQHPELLNHEPRILHQVMQRWGSELGYFRAPDLPSNTPAGTIHRDWSFVLGGGRLAPEMFPAKYSFDPGAPPSCQSDYVVFALNVVGVTNGQANLVGLHNLYAGAGGLCTGPNEYFAYNTTTVAGGKNETSPVLSELGDKIAFVETIATRAIFHVLTWTAGQGTMQRAANPGAAMTSLTFAASGSTRSSPWIDYLNDTAYVGADDGKVYKITGVFKGTPALAGSPWPVQIGTPAFPLQTPPVLDSRLGLLMVGNGNGRLYSINIATGAVNSIAIGRFRALDAGVLAPPIVDVTNGTTFVVSSNDGTSAVLAEVDTATLTLLAKGRIGIGAASGTDVKLYQPALDNNYFNNPSTGKIRLCGTGAGNVTPWQYGFSFTGRVMNTAPVFSQQLLNSTTARCTGWAEFFNPNVSGGTDYFFFGLLLDCGAGTTGCVKERVSDAQIVTFNLNNGPSGAVVDNYSTGNPQTSNIYVTDQKAPNRAYKLTQQGLN